MDMNAFELQDSIKILLVFNKKVLFVHYAKS